MNALHNFVLEAWIERLGWTLLHSVWQLAAAGLLFALFLSAARRCSPQLRYLAAAGTLAVMTLLPVVTWTLLPAWHATAPAETTVESVPDAGSVRDTAPLQSEPLPQIVFLDAEQPPLDGDRRPTLEPASPHSPAAAAAPADDRWTASTVKAVEPWLPWTVGLWGAGVLALSLWHLGGWLLIGRMKRQGIALTARPALRLVCELQQRLRLSRPVLLLESAAVRVPTTFGWLRPAVLLPVGLATGLPLDQLQAILAHELAHIRRRDYLVNLLQVTAETLLFFHPAVWWVSHRVRVEREYCADEAAAAACGSRLVYAKALTAVEERRSRLPGLALAANDGHLKRRIESVLGLTNSAASARAIVPAGLLAVLFAATFALALTMRPAEATGDGEATVVDAARDDQEAGAAAQPEPKEEQPKKEQPKDEEKAEENAAPKEPPNPLKQAVERGADFLRKAQQADGTWSSGIQANHRVGVTALCSLALLKTGSKPTDAAIQNALATLRKAEPAGTYDIAMQTVMLCAVEPKKDMALIQRNVELLEASQLTNDHRGGWTYAKQGIIDGAGDNSNSGFAVWALDQAAHAGAKVKQQTWERALAYWKKGQREDGSWGYTVSNGKGTGSMTCTGIASLAVCLNHKPADEVTKAEKEALDRGIVWLTDNFSVEHNPGGDRGWTLYYLMKLRRMGEMTGVRYLGDGRNRYHRWYSELATYLQEQQEPRDGGWNKGGPITGREGDTAFALLALQTGPPPQLAAEADRTWGLEGRVVDELDQPVENSHVVVTWRLGGRLQHSVARTDRKGHFALVYPPKYIKIEHINATDEKGRGGRVTIVGLEPLVLEVPRYRHGIQGIWQVVSWEQAGRKEKADDIHNRQVFVTADKVIVWDGHDKESEESYTIDPAVVPQQIDLVSKDDKAPGIFRLQDYRLTLCLDRAGRGRPSKFASEVVSPAEYLIELKRADAAAEIKLIKGIDARANRRVAASLTEHTMVEFVDTSLTDALQFLGDLHNVDVDAGEADLKKAGADPDAPITLKLEGVDLHTALQMLLRPLKLGYELRDGRLVVVPRGNVL